MGGTFTAVLYRRDDGQWVGQTPSVVQVEDGATARDAGLDYADALGLAGDDWLVKVWPGERPDLFAAPATVVRGDDRSRRGGPALRPGRRRHPWRTSGPAGRVLTARRATEVQLGEKILVTRDRGNTAASECGGDLYPAADPREATAAFVRQARHHMRGREVVAVDLVTSAGTVEGLRPDRAVLPIA